MEDILKLIKNSKSIAMLAPTFPVDFPYPNIIGMLKKLDFDFVTEITHGAKVVNREYIDYVKKNPNQKYFFTSPCPAVVELINNQYPDLKKYLMPVASPMATIAQIYRKNYPDHKIIFISPCVAKKNIEAPRYKKYIDSVLTFKDLQKIFDDEKITPDQFNEKYFFDSLPLQEEEISTTDNETNIERIEKLFKPEEILIADSIDEIKKSLDEVISGTSHYRFFDFLNCPGGCINGPGRCNTNLNYKKRRNCPSLYQAIFANQKNN